MFKSSSVRAVFVVLVGAVVALAVSPASAGLFSSAAMTGDSDSGISSSNTYTAAVNLGGSNVTVNGVLFTGSGANTSGAGWALTTGAGNTLYQVTGRGAGNVTGSVGGLLGDFYVTGDEQVADVLTVSGLTPGTTYTLTTYDKGWTPAGTRIVNVTASDGSSTTVDEDYLGVNNGSKFSYAYVATGTTMALSFVPQHMMR